ncbi:MAG: hypothetical protein ABIH66_04110 [bacterium]
MMTTPSREQVLAQIDPLYFLDYALFTGSVRHHASDTFERAFKEDPNPAHRRLHCVNVNKEKFAAYEDVGAFLNAFLDYRRGDIDIPIISLIEYRTKDVIISKLFEKYEISSGQELYSQLKLDDWIPSDWNDWFSHLDLKKALKKACNFFFDDCSKNQDQLGVVAYNKIKHGLLVVPSGKCYLPDLPDSPAVIISTSADSPTAQTHPFTLYGFKSSDIDIEGLHREIYFIQNNLRLFAALYVVWRYPETLKTRGVSDPKSLFESAQFEYVRHTIGEVTAKS